jgi:dTDP-4-dehydrorhamnose reductase
VFYSELRLLRNWADDLRGGKSVNAFTNYVCAPVSLATVTEGLLKIAGERRGGFWQFSGPQDMTYSEVAQTLSSLVGAQPELVRAVPLSGQVEAVPRFTTLDTARVANELGLNLPSGREVLAGLFGGANR